MGSSDRFYQLEFRNRPVLKGDIGSLLQVVGVVVGGGGAEAVLMLPSAPEKPTHCSVHRMTVEEWSDWLQRSDNPEILVNGSLEKAFHRKLRYEVSGAVQQKVWVADGLQCVYCDKKMGDVQLTIDHFVPLELGGKNDPSNYVSACRRCNKDKGSEAPAEFCKRRGYDYQAILFALEHRKVV